MIEVKVQCGCGTRYKFDVEPLSGRMPVLVSCPTCGADGTAAANEVLRQQTPATGAVRLVTSAPAATEQSHGAASAPRGLLDRHVFLVKERVAIVKLTDTFDIFDPGTGEKIGVAREEPPTWAKWLRLVVNKKLLPTSVNIYEREGAPPLASIHRGFTFLRPKIRVVAGDHSPLGYFKSKLFSLGGGFFVFDNADRQVAEIKGDWKGWNFKFLNNSGREIGTVTKKWAGLGKELFTSADNYVISLTDPHAAGPAAGVLLLAAGVSIDIVFKETGG